MDILDRKSTIYEDNHGIYPKYIFKYIDSFSMNINVCVF